MSVEQKENLKRNHNILFFLLFFLIIFSAYSLLLSRNYNLDGIAHLITLRDGQIKDYFPSRHMLYLPISAVFYKIWQFLGYQGNALIPLQVMNSLMGAIGVTFIAISIFRMIHSRLISVLCSSLFAFSYGYWIQCTDVHFVIMSILPIILMFFFAEIYSEEGRTKRPLFLFLMGLSTALGILIYIPNVFFIIFGLAIIYTTKNNNYIKTSMFYLLSAGIPVILTFIFVGILVHNCFTLHDLFIWLTTYQTLPIWCTWGWDRILKAFLGFIAAIIPLCKGLGLRDLAQGILHKTKIISQLSLFSFALLFCYSISYFFRNFRTLNVSFKKMILYFVVSLLPLAIFNIWFCPDDEQVWIIFTIPVWLITACILGDVLVKNKKNCKIVLSIACLSLFFLFTANFTRAIMPSRFKKNIGLEKAIMMGDKMSVHDIIITPFWDWTGYIPYFTNKRVISLPAKAGVLKSERNKVLFYLQNLVNEQQRKGGRVFIVNIFNYDEKLWKWIQKVEGLHKVDFLQFKLTPIFKCCDETIFELQSSTTEQSNNQK